MSNWNPLTNASGGGGSTQPNQYYNGSNTNFGEYSYIFLEEIVNNFTATYTGTNKILANVSRGDISFHAHRALQELSYDTLRSVKSQEIEVCPSLKMPLPHDYVNNVKLTSVDGNGIEHIIYPTRHTSNPFAISQSDGCKYDINPDGTLKHQDSCAADVETICNPTEVNDWFNFAFGGQFQEYRDEFGALETPMEFVVGEEKVIINSEYELIQTVTQKIDTYCKCVNSIPSSSVNCGSPLVWEYDTSIWDVLTAIENGGSMEVKKVVSSSKQGNLLSNYIIQAGINKSIEELISATQTLAKGQLATKQFDVDFGDDVDGGGGFGAGGSGACGCKDGIWSSDIYSTMADGSCKQIHSEGEACDLTEVEPVNWYCDENCKKETTNCFSFLTVGIYGGWSIFSVNESWVENEALVKAAAKFAENINLKMFGQGYGSDQDKCIGIRIKAPQVEGTAVGICTPSSNAWDNFSKSSGTTTGLNDPSNPNADNSNYFLNSGQRYGLEPEHAQINGSYYIDYLKGNIHFGSGLAGKTIILKYLSDGHGTDSEMMIPKLAEEAMYKWIAYGCAQARTDVDQGTIARLKREKSAETRKAKIRLSNIKIEELAQVMRGKSKWIKH